MNYFRWQSEAGRAWLVRKSAERVTAKTPVYHGGSGIEGRRKKKKKKGEII